MGLSKVVNDKAEINELRLLSLIAQGIGKLASDPKALEKSIKESYELSESEQQKADVAKREIAKNEALLAEVDKKIEQIAADSLNLDQKKASTAKIFDDIRKEQARLADIEAKLGARALDYDAKDKQLIEREKAVANAAAKNETTAALLEKRAQAVIADEKSLKERIQKMQGLVNA